MNVWGDERRGDECRTITSYMYEVKYGILEGLFVRPPPTLFPKGLWFSALTIGGCKCQELGKPFVPWFLQGYWQWKTFRMCIEGPKVGKYYSTIAALWRLVINLQRLTSICFLGSNNIDNEASFALKGESCDLTKDVFPTQFSCFARRRGGSGECGPWASYNPINICTFVYRPLFSHTNTVGTGTVIL